MNAKVHILGGGPAGLMAAETARAAGAEVDVYDRMGSVGRKFLIAGKGGLNLTHSDPFDVFVTRYGARSAQVERWLRSFDADALRAWAAGLGVETFVGSSGRVFPRDLKAAPLLRGWVRRLRADGVRFHVNHEWRGWNDDGALRFATGQGEIVVRADALVLVLGGASWPVLGSDGLWTSLLAARSVDIAPLRPSNCGFDIAWSTHFSQRYAGYPLKPVALEWTDASGATTRKQGECVVTQSGIEGSLVYAFSAALRDAIDAHGQATIHLDLMPDRSVESLTRALTRGAGKRSLSEHWRRSLGLDGCRVGKSQDCALVGHCAFMPSRDLLCLGGFNKSRRCPFGHGRTRTLFVCSAMHPHEGPAPRQPDGDMVFHRSDRDIKPDSDLLLRQALHFAKDEHLRALGRKSRNRTRQQPDTCATIDNIINRGLTAIIYDEPALKIP